VNNMELKKIFDEVFNEVTDAQSKWNKFNSLHEAYAVLLEENEELWEEVKKSQKNPVYIKFVKREAIQVAAMAIRLIFDCCD